jgi:ribulose-phosphate 3-epimerase
MGLFLLEPIKSIIRSYHEWCSLIYVQRKNKKMQNKAQKNFYIAPSILSADFTNLGEQVRLAEYAGCDWIHVDIMDGHFVPNMSMGRLALEACRRVTELPLDVHLMVKEPENFVEIFANSGADHLTVHIEATPNIHRLLQNIKEFGCRAGITLNPGTPACVIEPVLHMVEQVLVLTVNPGFGGQSFLTETIPKIKEIRQMLDQINPDALIEVDGGISVNTLPQVIDAGAQVFVAGSAIFKHHDGIAAGIQSLQSLLPA